jgi:molecular chaperone GrpE (heat shock protein)
LDLQAREAEIAKLREEYVLLEKRHTGAAEAAARDAVAGVLRALAPTLSQLATLRQMAESGREIRAADALKLGGKLEQALLERGLERIGEVGAEALFDPALHQRMSGGDVRDGDPVRVRFVGYRFAGQPPVKALVSRVEPASSEDSALTSPSLHHPPPTTL